MRNLFLGVVLSAFIFSAHVVVAKYQSKTLKPSEEKHLGVKKEDSAIPTATLQVENQKQDVDAIPDAEEETDSKSNRELQEKTQETIRDVILDQI